MKLTLFLSILTISQLWATETYSQLTKLTLKLNDVKIVDALKEIENHSEFFFLYSPKLIDVERKVNIDAEKEPIKEILSDVFGTKVDFFVYDKQIILTPSDLSRPYLEMQQRTITGTVTGKDGTPIPGVNVVVTGTIQGTITDMEGKYIIQIPEGSKSLTFTFIGMEPQEISIGTLTQINATMVESAVGLDEVVVVGYGTQKKKDVTGSVSSISDTKFADMPISSMSQALIGQIPGLDVVSSGNSPGDGDQILLRGRRSFVASNDPLLILDGMPYYGSINDINPYDIKAVDVLKDASSTAIYGSQGANGVILITTKRGEIGSPKFMLESYVGTKATYGELPVMNGQQFAERGREAKRAAGSYNDPGINDALDKTIFRPVEYNNLIAGKWDDYQDMLLQNGFTQKHQLSVIGGTKAIRYNIAANALSEEGIIPDSKFDRYSLRTNLDLSLSEKVTLGTSYLLTYNIQSNKTSPGTLNEALRNSPLGSPYADDGTPRFDPADDGYRVNPLSEYLWDSYRSDNKNWAAFINLFAEVKILPVLSYRINLGTDINLNTNKNSAGNYSIVRRGDIPNANISNYVSNRKIYESILTFDKTFNSTHHLTLTAVQSIQTSRYEASGLSVGNLPYIISRYYNVGSAAVINSVSSDLSEWNLLSYVGRLNYGYKSKYLMTVSLRTDGATQFAPGHKWGYFPSVALGWRISEEKFMKSFEWISNMKLRLSYGVSGNQAINPYQTQGILVNTTYAWDESAAYGLRPSELANKKLKWESTAAYNIGLDFGFFKGRISGNMDFYKTNTYDLLLYRKLPSTTGFDQVLENIGNTNNKGFELGLHTINIDKSNFIWSSDVSFYSNREEIVELYNGKVDDIGNRWFIGHPIQVYYDFKKIGIWQTDEAETAATYASKPGDLKILDTNSDGAITDADRIIIGTRQPKFVFDFSNTFKYKNLDLSAKMYLRWGNTTALNELNLQPINRENQFMVAYWTPDNSNNAFPRPDSRALIQPYGSTQTYRDGSFIRLRQLSLGYTFPKSLLDHVRISNARVYLTGDNLFYWTKSEFRDFNIEPESSGDLSAYPATRSFIVGINITF